MQNLWELLRSYAHVTEDDTEWECQECSLRNALNFVQCEACFKGNESWRHVLESLQVPYETRNTEVTATVKGLYYRSLSYTRGNAPTTSLAALLQHTTGYFSVTNNWKCACGTYNACERLACLHCTKKNYELQRVMDLVGLTYTFFVPEQVQEDPLPLSLLVLLERKLFICANLLFWNCPACTNQNSTEYVQCICGYMHAELETLNMKLGVPVLRLQLSLVDRLRGRQQGSGQSSGKPLLRLQLELATGMSDPYQVWKCPICSLNNSYEYVVCRVCSFANSSLQDLLFTLGLTWKSRVKGYLTTAKELYHHLVDRVQTAAVCPICELTIGSADLKPLSVCSHCFHPACLKDFVSTQVKDKHTRLQCPVAECGKDLSMDDIRMLFSPYEFECYLETSMKNYLASQGNKIRSCPTPDCSYSFIFTGEKEFQCEKCGKSYCFRCQSPAHAPETCEDYRTRLKVLPLTRSPMTVCPTCNYRFRGTEQETCPNCKVKYCLRCHASHPLLVCQDYWKTLDKGEHEALFQQFATGSKFKICAACGVWVEKTSGCNHITCHCGYQFCYICGSDWLLGRCLGHQFQ